MEDRIAELADRLDHLALDLAQLKRQAGQARAEQGALAAEVRQGFARLADLVRQQVAGQEGVSRDLNALVENMRNAADLAGKQVELAERTTGFMERTTDALYKLAGRKPPDQPEPETQPKRKP